MSDAPISNPACATSSASAYGKIRLYVGVDLTDGAGVEFSRDQTHYLVNVMREGVGARVLVFNGRDGEWSAEIVKAGKRSCMAELRQQTRDQDGVPDLHLLFAPVKKARLDFLVQKATELGVAAIRPVRTARTNVARIKDERMAANVIEAAEQCGRLTVPEVLGTLTLDQALCEIGDRKIMFCDEGGDVAPAAQALSAQESGPWAVLIGPEGGFSDEERAMLHAHEGCVPVSLGPRIMRADTAAIAALSLWQAALGDW